MKPADQGRPANHEPTPIEKAYRDLRDLTDQIKVVSPYALNEPEIAKRLDVIAESVRQAAIYDASHKERERALRETAKAARGKTLAYAEEMMERIDWLHVKLAATLIVSGTVIITLAVALGAVLQ